MIDRQKGKYVLICDNCGESSSDEFDTFQDAVDAKADQGFTSKKYADGWKDLCGECKN